MNVTAIIRPHIEVMQLNYAKSYQANGNAFVGAFVKYRSIRSMCAFCCQQFEKEIAGYEQDEKIVSFVAKQGLDDVNSKLLARTLKMIKLIIN